MEPLKIFRGPFTVIFKAEECMEPEDFDDSYCFTSSDGLICIHKYVEGVTDPSADTMVRIYNWDTLIGIMN